MEATQTSVRGSNFAFSVSSLPVAQPRQEKKGASCELGAMGGTELRMETLGNELNVTFATSLVESG